MAQVTRGSLHGESYENAQGLGPSTDVSGCNEVILSCKVNEVRGTGATLDLQVQHSRNGVNWTDLFEDFQQGLYPRITEPGISSIRITKFSKYIRLKWDINGTDPQILFKVDGILKLNGSMMDNSPRGPYCDIRAYGAIPNDHGAAATNTKAFNDAIEDISVQFGGFLYIPPGKWVIDDEIVIKSGVNIIGVGNHWRVVDSKPGDPTKNSWICYDGGLNDKKAVFRVSPVKVGSDPGLAAVVNARIEGVVLDGNRKAGYGLYLAAVTDDCSFERIAITRCNVHGFFLVKCWYATFRDIIAVRNIGCGITVGPNQDTIDSQGFADFNYAVNAVLFENLRANNNGLKFQTMTNPPPILEWDPINHKHDGYGIGFYPSYGNLINRACSEGNRGAGIVIKTPMPVNSVESIYLEKNCRDQNGKPWPHCDDDMFSIIYEHDELNIPKGGGGCAITVRNVAMSSSETIWITGDPPGGPDSYNDHGIILENISEIKRIKADSSAYSINGYCIRSMGEDEDCSDIDGLQTKGKLRLWPQNRRINDEPLFEGGKNGELVVAEDDDDTQHLFVFLNGGWRKVNTTPL